MTIESKTVLVPGSTDGVGRLVNPWARSHARRVIAQRISGRRSSLLPRRLFLARGGASPRRHRPL